MFKNKWLLLSALVAGSSIGFVACGTDSGTTSCTSDSDCDSGQACVEGACADTCTSNNDCQEGSLCLSGGCFVDCSGDEFVCGSDATCQSFGGSQVCRPTVAENTCQADADCPSGQLCDTTSGTCFAETSCSNSNPCPSGLTCNNGTCEPSSVTECTQAVECASDDGYCSVDNKCVPFACGTTFNDCGRCAAGPGGGSRSNQGPVIYLPEQVGTCTRDASKCQTDAPFVCTWSFNAYDVEGNLNFSSPTVKVITSSGNLVNPFGVSGNAGAGTIRFSACFPQTSTGNVGTAVVVQDSAGNNSNSLCVAGNLQ